MLQIGDIYFMTTLRGGEGWGVGQANQYHGILYPGGYPDLRFAYYLYSYKHKIWYPSKISITSI